VADGARRQAEVQRDEAERQRDENERQLLTTQRNLQTAQEAVAALKTFDPKAAAHLSTELATASTAADRELRTLIDERERLRRERDEALASVQKLSQENAGFRQNQQRPAPAAAIPASEPSVTVPDCVAEGQRRADAVFRAVGLRAIPGWSRTWRAERYRQSPKQAVWSFPEPSSFCRWRRGPPAKARSDTGQATQSHRMTRYNWCVLQDTGRLRSARCKSDCGGVSVANVASLQAALNQLSG
jgi:hypothetical protein